MSYNRVKKTRFYPSWPYFNYVEGLQQNWVEANRAFYNACGWANGSGTPIEECRNQLLRLINMDPYNQTTLSVNETSDPIRMMFRSGIYRAQAEAFVLNWFGVLGHNFADANAGYKFFFVDSADAESADMDGIDALITNGTSLPITSILNSGISADEEGHYCVYPLKNISGVENNYNYHIFEEESEGVWITVNEDRYANGTSMVEIDSKDVGENCSKYIVVEIFPKYDMLPATVDGRPPSENVVAYPDHPHTEGVSIHEDLIDKHKTEMPAPPHHEGYRPIREFGKNIETENLTPYSDQAREITPGTFSDDLNLGSFAWGVYFDMPISPNLNFNMTMEYDGVELSRSKNSGADHGHIKFIGSPGFIGDYQPFGCGHLSLNNQKPRRQYEFTYTAIADAPTNASETGTGDTMQEQGFMWPHSMHHSYRTYDSNDFFSRVYRKTCGGQLPFIFELNNEIKETGSDSTWPNGDHNEDHFMFARFTSNSLTFEHTYHRMWTINVTIEDTW